jgi:hypothetical protein
VVKVGFSLPAASSLLLVSLFYGAITPLPPILTIAAPFRSIIESRVTRLIHNLARKQKLSAMSQNLLVPGLPDKL